MLDLVTRMLKRSIVIVYHNQIFFYERKWHRDSNILIREYHYCHCLSWEIEACKTAAILMILCKLRMDVQEIMKCLLSSSWI